MFTRKEYEEIFGKISDKEWAELLKQIGEIEEKMWEEDHPLDE